MMASSGENMSGVYTRIVLVLFTMLSLLPSAAIAQRSTSSSTSTAYKSAPVTEYQPTYPSTTSATEEQARQGKRGNNRDRPRTTEPVNPIGRLGASADGRTGLRIENRIQSRIRSRIDRYYDPQANALSPFKVAGEQARTTSKGRTPGR